MFSRFLEQRREWDQGSANSSTGKREQVMSWHGLHNHAEKDHRDSRACAAVDYPPNALATSHNVLCCCIYLCSFDDIATLPLPCVAAANRSQTRPASPMNTSIRSRHCVSCSLCHRPAKIPRPYPHVLHSQPLAFPYAHACRCLQFRIDFLDAYAVRR